MAQSSSLFRFGGRLTALLGVGLGIATIASPGLPLAANPTAPHVVIASYTPGRLVLGERRYVIVRGILQNHGPGPATDFQMTFTARREPGGEVLGEGGGVSWLDALDAGESGPFTAVVPYCCPEDIGAYDLTLSAAPAPADRYRALEVTGQVRREAGGLPWIYGDLVNTGADFLDVSATDVYMGFWKGEDLVMLDTARMPVLHSLGDPTGQSHPPGWRYPWAVQVPDVPFDRTEVWFNAAAFPPEVFPVPLGAQAVAAAREGADIQVRATIAHCGLAPAENLVVMVVARDAEDRVVEFGLAQPRLAAPIRPGDRVPIHLTWPGARAEIEPQRLSLWPLALESQNQRPSAIPCPPLLPVGLLPALLLRVDPARPTAITRPSLVGPQ